MLTYTRNPLSLSVNDILINRDEVIPLMKILVPGFEKLKALTIDDDRQGHGQTTKKPKPSYDGDGNLLPPTPIVLPKSPTKAKVEAELAKTESYAKHQYNISPQAAKDTAKINVRESIDLFKDTLLPKYTSTEQAGWALFLPEAKAVLASGNADDAPGLSLQAAIEGKPVADVANAIVTASAITGMLPHLAAGIRSRANALIDATDGTTEAIQTVTDLLQSKQTELAVAIQGGNQNAVLQAVTVGWDV